MSAASPPPLVCDVLVARSRLSPTAYSRCSRKSGRYIPGGPIPGGGSRQPPKSVPKSPPR
eukprot:5654917-Pyramimonas_sp.AAC.1